MNYPMIKILIISKAKDGYGFTTATSLSTGLYNSAHHVEAAITKTKWAEINLVSVVDNNSIDREVTLFSPDIVIIEALWVVPDKFEILKSLHPTVKWVIRIHSEVPFLSFEGIAFNWIRRYLNEQNIYVALNSKKTFTDFKNLFPNCEDQILYLPNHFQLPDNVPNPKPDFGEEVHIGCFGAIRGLKNQMAQALAAIAYADRNGVKLYYHINFSPSFTYANAGLKISKGVLPKGFGTPDTFEQELKQMCKDYSFVDRYIYSFSKRFTPADVLSLL